MKEKFSRAAKTKHYDIKALNEAVKRAVANNVATNDSNKYCSLCTRQFTAKAKPTMCQFCFQYFHKTNCLHSHSSQCQARISKTPGSVPTTIPRGSTSLSLLTTSITATSEATNPTSTGNNPTSLENPFKRPRTDTAVGNTVPIESLPSSVLCSYSSSLLSQGSSNQASVSSRASENNSTTQVI